MLPVYPTQTPSYFIKINKNKIRVQWSLLQWSFLDEIYVEEIFINGLQDFGIGYLFILLKSQVTLQNTANTRLEFNDRCI